MTLANTPTVDSYVGTGSVNVYPFNFVAFQAADISVIVTSPAGTNTDLFLGTDYTVSGLNPAGGPPSSGQITLVDNSQEWLTSGFLITGWSLVITRDVAVVQNTSIRNQGDFYQETIEDALDYLTMICQQLQQEITDISTGGGGGGGGGGTTNIFDTDIVITTAGDGLILVTPDGTKTYRVGIANNGALSATRLT